MNDEVRLAFAHPAERAEATAGDEPRDRISLRDYIREVEIGAFQQERGTRQRLRFNVVVEVAGKGASLGDDVDRVVSYDAIAEAIDAELAGERLNLLETLAEKVAARILREARTERVFVRVEKLDRAPAALGVEIVRKRSAHEGRVQAPPAQLGAIRPRVIYLGNAVFAGAGPGALMDQLAGEKTPAVFCVGRPEGTVPRCADPAAQRRIDLLAIEQNAWVLAATDSRFVVVASRTELEWAFRHKVMALWAPSRMVLDAGEAEAAPVGDDCVALALWLAVQFNALELVVAGAPLPATTSVPVRAPEP